MMLHPSDRMKWKHCAGFPAAEILILETDSRGVKFFWVRWKGRASAHGDRFEHFCFLNPVESLSGCRTDSCFPRFSLCYDPELSASDHTFGRTTDRFPE